VSVVLDNLAAGLSEADILRQYPTLTPDAALSPWTVGSATSLAESNRIPEL
jgi:uncharacterized protein (DUF433 family)